MSPLTTGFCLPRESESALPYYSGAEKNNRGGVGPLNVRGGNKEGGDSRPESRKPFENHAKSKNAGRFLSRRFALTSGVTKPRYLFRELPDKDSNLEPSG